MPRSDLPRERNLPEGGRRRDLPDPSDPPRPIVETVEWGAESKIRPRVRVSELRMEIWDSVAIVTGSSRGIGRAIAAMLAGAGASVVINARDKSEALLQVADILGPPGRVLVAPGDVGDFDVCRGIVRSAQDRFGHVDILVNNAGTFGLKRFAEMEPEDWESMFRVHVFGSFNMSRHVLPDMIRRKRGVIVNIASFVAVRPPGPGRVHYAAAKSALLALPRGRRDRERGVELREPERDPRVRDVLLKARGVGEGRQVSDLLSILLHIPKFRGPGVDLRAMNLNADELPLHAFLLNFRERLLPNEIRFLIQIHEPAEVDFVRVVFQGHVGPVVQNPCLDPSDLRGRNRADVVLLPGLEDSVPEFDPTAAIG